jgi:hypothetical protein
MGMNRLEELTTELAKVFGRITKWRWRCKEQNAVSEADQIKVAEEVLAEPCTGTVAEWAHYQASLKGVKSRQAPPYKPTGF